MTKSIVFNAHGGGVSICTPAPAMFDAMRCGGYWRDMPAGFVATQIERNIANGVAPDHARRFCRALAFGGLSEAEVYAVVRDRDCLRDGEAHDLIDPAELPDTWFRDAWSRGHNGGPVWVDVEKARPIQWRRIVAAVDSENARRARTLGAGRPYRLARLAIERAIRNARDDDELRRVWPEGLPC